MKKTILFIAMLMLSAGAFAQKYGYVEMKSILEQMPQYKTAIEQAEKTAKTYQTEVDGRLAKVQEMFAEYQKTKNKMTTTYQNLIEEEIIKQEKEANDFRESIFGQDGVMMKNQMEMMKPIEERVNAALAAVAKEKGLDMIFDASSDKSIVYKSANSNMTQAVVEKLK